MDWAEIGKISVTTDLWNVKSAVCKFPNTNFNTNTQEDPRTDGQTDRIFPTANHQTKEFSSSSFTSAQKVILNEGRALLFGGATSGLTY